MKLVRAKKRLPISIFNFEKRQNKSKHGSILPNTIRCIIAGPSNYGKTNLMINLITDINGLRFKNVYIYSKSLFQPKYEFLGKVLGKLPYIGYFTFSDNTDIMDPSAAKQDSVFIFDDVACDKQDKICAYFSMGRHKNVDCFYLCQSYSRTPKQLVRDNANLIIIFKEDDLNLRHVYDNHVNTDMTFQKFKEICGTCWKYRHGFLVINKDKTICEGRYSKAFDYYIYP